MNDLLNMDSDFKRLRIMTRPSTVWKRDHLFQYAKIDGNTSIFRAGELCQIGIHLSLGEENSGKIFCQIVNGKHRGLRFEYNENDFEHYLAVA